MSGSKFVAPSSIGTSGMLQSGLGISRWWEDPVYLAQHTLNDRGRYILTKLYQLDPARLRSASVKMYGRRQLEPEEIQAHEWQELLASLGATRVEVREVVQKLGFSTRGIPR